MLNLKRGFFAQQLIAAELQDASRTEKPVSDFAHTAKYHSCMHLGVDLVGSTKQIRSSLFVSQQQLQYNLSKLLYSCLPLVRYPF
jgi:hypothetical protein